MYFTTNNDEIGERTFLGYRDAKEKACGYLRSHTDIILADDVKPLSIAAYSYVRAFDDRVMTAFYCDLGDAMYYIQEFMTFHYICKGKKWSSMNLSMGTHRRSKDMNCGLRICTNA